MEEGEGRRGEGRGGGGRGEGRGGKGEGDGEGERGCLFVPGVFALITVFVLLVLFVLFLPCRIIFSLLYLLMCGPPRRY